MGAVVASIVPSVRGCFAVRARKACTPEGYARLLQQEVTVATLSAGNGLGLPTGIAGRSGAALKNKAAIAVSKAILHRSSVTGALTLPVE